jgi:hypothetical protein
MRKHSNLAGLMVFTAFLGVAAASRSGSPFWTNVVFYLTLFVLFFASYRARYSTGRRAAWWFGFALCGWFQFAIGPFSNLAYGVPGFEAMADYPTVPIAASLASFMEAARGETDSEAAGRTCIIINCQFTLLAGLVGGMVARFVAARTKAVERREGPPA